MKDIRNYLRDIEYFGDCYDVDVILTKAYEEVIKLNPKELDALKENTILCHLVPLASAYAEITNSRKV